MFQKAKPYLVILGLLAAYGIVGRIDYAEALRAEYKPHELRLSCLPVLPEHDIAPESPSYEHESRPRQWSAAYRPEAPIDPDLEVLRCTVIDP
jgi:hypothetical protein